jgi:L-serine deaminase
MYIQKKEQQTRKFLLKKDTNKLYPKNHKISIKKKKKKPEKIPYEKGLEITKQF